MSAVNSPAPMYTAAGVAVPYTGAGTAASPYVNALTLGTTYYVELGSEFFSTGVVQWVHDASIVITSITYQSTALPRAALTTWESTATKGWADESSITTITAAGGSAACPRSPISGVGMERLRAIVVVGATGGSCVPFQNWKVA